MSPANRFHAIAHVIPGLELRRDQPVLAELKAIGQLRRERRLAIGRKPGQLAFVPQPPKPASFGRKRISISEPRTRNGRQKPAVIAVETLELAPLERAHAVADV